MSPFDRLQRVMVLGIQVPDGPALAAKDHRLRFRPEVVVNHAVQKLAVGHPGGRKGDVVAAAETTAGVDPAKFPDPRGPAPFFVAFRPPPEPPWDLAPRAFSSA